MGFLLAEENVAEGGLVLAKRFYNEQFWDADKDAFDEGYLDYLENYYHRKSGSTTYEYSLFNSGTGHKQPSSSRGSKASSFEREEISPSLGID
jgi:hypothetical protein